MLDFRVVKSFSLTLFLILWCSTMSAENSDEIEVTVTNWVEGDEIWVGVVEQEQESSSVQWEQVSTSKFSVEIPDAQQLPVLIFLKRDAVPVMRSLTTDLVSTPLDIEFAAGSSIKGSVSTKKFGTLVTEGTVSIIFDEEFQFPLPDPSWCSWPINSDGTYELHGIPPGKFVVTASSHGFMPAKETLIVDEDSDLLERNFQLSNAFYIDGSIKNSESELIQGVLDAMVSPEESQTTPIRTHFDEDSHFQIGPFAEEASIELTARLPDGRRSRPITVNALSENVKLQVGYWVRVQGRLQNHDSGEAIEEVQLMISLKGRALNTFKHVAPNGILDLEIDDLSKIFSIQADGFLFWTSGDINLVGKSSFDFGVIELVPARLVRGIVLDRATREPIADVSLRRLEYETPFATNWYYNDVATTTDTDGEFELKGFPPEGGSVQVAVKGYQTVHHTFENVDTYLEIEMEPSGNISGQIVSVDGEPTAGRIYLEDSMGGIGRPSKDGNFHFEVNDGTYTLYATTASGRSSTEEVIVENGESITDVQLEIDITGRVTGTVKGLAEGETVSIRIGDYSQRSSTFVESNGPYELVRVSAGEHTVSAKTSLNRYFTDTVLVNLTRETKYDLDLSGDFTLDGHVFAGGHPLASVEVVAFLENKTPLRELKQAELYLLDELDKHIYSFEVRTNSERDGSYRLEGLIEGTYRIEVQTRSFTEDVVVDSDTNFDIQLGSLSLSGRVNASGSVRGAQVRVIGSDKTVRSISLQMSVDSIGSYRFQGLPSGRYTIRVNHPDYEEKSQSIMLERTTSDVDILLNPTTNQ